MSYTQRGKKKNRCNNRATISEVIVNSEIATSRLKHVRFAFIIQTLSNLKVMHHFTLSK